MAAAGLVTSMPVNTGFINPAVMMGMKGTYLVLGDKIIQ